MEIILYLLAIFGVFFIVFGLWFLSVVGKAKRKIEEDKEILKFNDNEAAFIYSSEYMDTNISQGKPTIALSVQKKHEQGQPIMIKVAGDPPFFAHAGTYLVGSNHIKEGDLLGVIPLEKVEHITSYMDGDERKQWFFLVIAAVSPKFHLKKQMWSVEKNFLND